MSGAGAADDLQSGKKDAQRLVDGAGGVSSGAGQVASGADQAVAGTGRLLGGTRDLRNGLEKLSKGDEVLTNGGIAGVVTDIGENFITVEVADGVRLRIQKGAIANVLPKGTLKSA